MTTQSPKVLLRIAVSLALLLAVLLLALWIKPPDILRVGANYSAKIICSNVFLAARDPEEVLRSDVKAPGIALLRLMRVSVDREHRVVRAGLLGFIGDGLAVARPGVGCAAVPDGDLDFATHASVAASRAPTSATGTTPASAAAPTLPGAGASAGASAPELWPDGTAVATTNALDRILADDTLAG